MAFLIGANNKPILSPDAIARRRSVADAYLTASRDTSPIQSWTQGAAKLADALVGGLQYRKANSEEQQGRQQANDSVAKLVAALSGGKSPSFGDVATTAQDPFLNQGQAGIVGALLGKQFQAPPETWEDATVNGMPGQRNKSTGKFDPFPTTAKERAHAEDQFGVDRYLDSGEAVFPNAGKPGTINVNAPDGSAPSGFTNAAAVTTSDPDPVAARQPLFGGKTLQGQVLNQMYTSGAISKEEAWQKAISDESYRPLTDPKERAYYGIPPEDKTPYLIDTDNKISSFGGGGVKIENNLGPTAIDYGDPEKGMVWARDSEGKVQLQKDPKTGYMRPIAVPIAGGSIEQQAAADAAKETDRKALASTGAGVVVQDVDRALAAIEANPTLTTGIVGSLTQGVPGTPAYNTGALITTIKANAAFDKLQALRAASPTGGALGNVSDTEGRLLASAIGNLEQAQGTQQITDNLKRVKNLYLDTIYGSADKRFQLVQQGQLSDSQNKAIDALYSRPSFEAAKPDGGIPNVSSDAEYDALPSGAQFRDPDGVLRRKP